MRHRLFIAINLDEAVRRGIAKLQEELEVKLDREMLRQIRFMPPENWHLTVSFLGYEDDAELPKIVRAMGAAAKHFLPPEVVFDDVLYGPPRGGTKRMIWIHATDTVSKNISAIKQFLEDQLVAEGVPFSREARPFSGHITLARFNNEIPNASLPKIEQSLRLRCTAVSLDLMESTLSRAGAEYAVLQKSSFPE
ncbi:MAG: RNA 2',3'-cyclic phosphodiesterase [Minisyncoccia bacterium]|jgi:2'-5' RNA ligase